MTLIACSRMYDLNAPARAAWAGLFSLVSRHAGVPLEVIEHAAPALLESLWERADMGCVFMCGRPFTRSRPRPQIVAAPLPRHPRYGGRPVYFTKFMVRADRGYRNLEDTFGGRLAWTVEGSHSGFNAPRHHLLAYRSAERPVLYPQTVGPVVTPLAALDSVRQERADVAPLDSYAFDLVRRHEPGRLHGLAAIAITEAAPIPPLVAAPGVDAREVGALRDALLGASSRPAFADVLDALELSGFALPEPADYDVIAARDAEARVAGYPFPG